MDDIFSDQIILRDKVPTRLVLPGLGTQGNISTISWSGNLLKEDWILVPGLAGCMGIICIANTPTKQFIQNPVATATNPRVSSARDSVRSLKRNAVRDPIILEDNFQKKTNSVRNSGSKIVGIDTYKTYVLHAMGKGHWVAKQKLQNIFARHPEKNSLVIYFYSTTDFGQAKWIGKERGTQNLLCFAGSVDVKADVTKLTTLFASPSLLDGEFANFRPYYNYDSPINYTPQLKNFTLPTKEHELNKADGVLTESDTEFTNKLFADDVPDGVNDTFNWAYAERTHGHNLKIQARAQWHNKDYCELCNRKVGSRFKAMFKDPNDLLARHHCRACARTVCGMCATKVSKIAPDKIKFVSIDPAITSYVCKECNTKNW